MAEQKHVEMTPSSFIDARKIGSIAYKVILKLIGKTPPEQTPNSVLMVLWLTNGEKFYRMVAFRDAIKKHEDKLLINSIIHFYNIYVDAFFKDKANPRHKDLQSDFQFSLSQESGVKIRQRGTLDEYPQENIFPPYWRIIPDIRIGDKYLAMRARALSKPFEASQQSDGIPNGVAILVADKSNKKCYLFVKCDTKDEDYKLFLEEVNIGVEILFHAGKAFDNNGSIAIEVPSPEFVRVMDEKKLIDTYEFVFAQERSVAIVPQNDEHDEPQIKKRLTEII